MVQIRELSGNTRIHFLPTEKFKTISVIVYLQQQLQEETATATALIPPVLERGTQKHPHRRDLKRTLDNLFGASLGGDVLKKGERQVLHFSLNMINSKYVKDGATLFEDGLHLLKEFLAEPVLEGNGFKRDYFNQEKEQLEKEIKSLLNDKVNYALERCVQHMCSDEPFSVYKYGRVEDLPGIEPDYLYDYYCQLRQSNPMDIFIIGEFDVSHVSAQLEHILEDLRPKGEEKKLKPAAGHHVVVGEVKYVEEELPVSQGKLTLGFRTHTPFLSEDYFPLLFYNGILGGYPHSKLFQNVREKASLAYYAFSRLEKHKGIMLIGSGIEVDNYHKALDIIRLQVEEMKKGNISHEEMENTRLALLNQLRMIEDNPFSLANFYHDGAIVEKKLSLSDFKEALKKVRIKDVVRVAEKIQLDTVYFLRSLRKEA
ncbi:MAG: insulinase family protein [Firmicutes bacterium]|nr:insulinase family protein [Bacillota bacterium]